MLGRSLDADANSFARRAVTLNGRTFGTCFEAPRANALQDREKTGCSDIFAVDGKLFAQGGVFE